MNFDGLSIWLLAGISVAGGVAIWISGIYLSNTVDALSKRLGLGQALGGMILLALAKNHKATTRVMALSLNLKQLILVNHKNSYSTSKPTKPRKLYFPS